MKSNLILIKKYFETINLVKFLVFIVLTILLLIGTFPNFYNWTFGRGIDASLIWVFNHIYEENWTIGKNIIFPHGPLAFFMYPSGESIPLVMFVQSLLKISLFLSIFFSFKNRNNGSIYISFIIAYLISVISGFNHLLLANIIFNYCAFYTTRISYFKTFALVLSAFAIFIKAYVAIISLVISTSFLFYSIITSKKKKETFIDIGILMVSTLSIWLALYHRFDGIFQYFIGMYNLAGDNSSAASYYPSNNWIYIVIAISSLATVLLISNTKRAHFYLILIGLSLFAAWKHGMAREDFSHQKGFIVYLFIIVWGALVSSHKKWPLKLVFGGATIFFFYLNALNSVNYSEPTYSINRAEYFIKFIRSINTTKENSKQRSLNQVEKSKISSQVKAVIKNSKVDIYPWEYSIIPANDLNWEPRVVLQSYAGYTSWLDLKNADHFNSSKSPTFIIWEKNRVSLNNNGNIYSSIDNRYLLNDEPHTMLSLLSNYKAKMHNDNLILLEKKITHQPINPMNHYLFIQNGIHGLKLTNLQISYCV